MSADIQRNQFKLVIQEADYEDLDYDDLLELLHRIAPRLYSYKYRQPEEAFATETEIEELYDHYKKLIQILVQVIEAKQIKECIIEVYNFLFNPSNRRIVGPIFALLAKRLPYPDIEYKTELKNRIKLRLPEALWNKCIDLQFHSPETIKLFQEIQDKIVTYPLKKRMEYLSKQENFPDINKMDLNYPDINKMEFPVEELKQEFLRHPLFNAAESLHEHLSAGLSTFNPEDRLIVGTPEQSQCMHDMMIYAFQDENKEQMLPLIESLQNPTSNGLFEDERFRSVLPEELRTRAERLGLFTAEFKELLKTAIQERVRTNLESMLAEFRN